MRGDGVSGLAIVSGDATTPMGLLPKVIVHVCNDAGRWGRGFVLALSRKWLEPEEDYLRWAQGAFDEPFALGQVRVVQVEEELWVANMIAQHGVRSQSNPKPIDYSALRLALVKVGDFARAHSAGVHMPRIGCGLAGGSWDEVEPIVLDALVRQAVSVAVYDLDER